MRKSINCINVFFLLKETIKEKSVVKVAIIDDLINIKYIDKNIKVEKIPLVKRGDLLEEQISHSTITAMILTRLCKEVSILNIPILEDKRSKGNVLNLIKALKICINEKVEIISLSIGSILMIDSYILEQTIKDVINANIVIVAASNNANIFTVPAAFKGVIGVKREPVKQLKPGEFYWDDNNLLGIQCIVNCDFGDIDNYIPSNSYAVPVIVAALANDYIGDIDCLVDRIKRKSRNIPFYADKKINTDFLYKWDDRNEVPNINIIVGSNKYEEKFFIEFMHRLHDEKKFLYVGAYSKLKINDVRYIDITNKKFNSYKELIIYLSNAFYVDYIITILLENELDYYHNKGLYAKATFFIGMDGCRIELKDKEILYNLNITPQLLAELVLKI